MKVVINRCFGGFSLSREAYKFLGLEWTGYGYEYSSPDIKIRTATELIKCVETLGDAANGMVAKLKVVEIPDDVEVEITEYDGLEQIEEIHQIWC